MIFSCRGVWQHVSKLITFISAPQIFVYIYSACLIYVIPCFHGLHYSVDASQPVNKSFLSNYPYYIYLGILLSIYLSRSHGLHHSVDASLPANTVYSQIQSIFEQAKSKKNNSFWANFCSLIN